MEFITEHALVRAATRKKTRGLYAYLPREIIYTDSVLLYRVSIVAHDKGDDIYEASDEFTRY